MTHQRGHTRSRRGVTFIETVLASSLLALVIATVLSVLSTATKAQARSQRFLGAAELANRLILMHLDDPDTMPSRSETIAYPPNVKEPIQYRWELETTPVDVEQYTEEGPRRRGQTTAISFEDRLESVRVRVWVSEKSGGAYQPRPGVPSVELVRLMDKFNFGRNPDSLRVLIGSEGGRERLFQMLLGPTSQPTPPPAGDGAQGGTGGGSSSGNRRSRP